MKILFIHQNFPSQFALAEFRHVLRLDVFALITLPDLRAMAEHIVHDELESPLCISPAGPINAVNVLFSHQASIADGNAYMAHRMVFTASSLAARLFKRAWVKRVYRTVIARISGLWRRWSEPRLPYLPISQT